MSDQIKFGLALLLVIAGISVYYFVDYFVELPDFLRIIILLFAGSGAVALALKTAQGQEAWEFLLDARLEVRKVIWPTFDETVHYTLIVLAMVVIMALLMWFLDALLLWVMRILAGPEG